MANFPGFHQSFDDPAEFCRASISQEINPDFAKLKKRKYFAENAEEFILPAAKHKCSGSGIDSEEDPLLTTLSDAENLSSDMDVLETQADSAQDSNSFPGDSLSFPGVKFNMDSGKIDSYDEASTSWSKSASAESLCGSFYSESNILSGAGDGKEETVLTGQEKYPQPNAGWDDSDFLDECISAEHFQDSKQQRSEGLDEFLSCSGMNPNLYALSAERWGDQGPQLGIRKPTIDQEFEQYFSTLML